MAVLLVGAVGATACGDGGSEPVSRGDLVGAWTQDRSGGLNVDFSEDGTVQYDIGPACTGMWSLDEESGDVTVELTACDYAYVGRGIEETDDVVPFTLSKDGDVVSLRQGQAPLVRASE